MSKLLGAVAGLAILAGATSAQAGYVAWGGTTTGLSFNDVQDGSGSYCTSPSNISSVCVQETTGSSRQYGVAFEGTNFSNRILEMPTNGNAQSGGGVNSPVSDAGVQSKLGQFVYQMYFESTASGNAGKNGSSAMSSINWDNGKIVLGQGTKDISFTGVGDAAGTTWKGRVTGGTLYIDSVTGDDTGIVEDLPYRLGRDRSINYEIDDGSTLTMRFTNAANSNQWVDATFDLSNLNIDDHDPFNGIMIDPTNGSIQDIAFFMFGHDPEISCHGFSSNGCGPFANSDKDDLSIKLAGWGSGDAQVPEPATLAILGLGLAGLGLARRRRKA